MLTKLKGMVFRLTTTVQREGTSGSGGGGGKQLVEVNSFTCINVIEWSDSLELKQC